jgi:hypothetical protein
VALVGRRRRPYDGQALGASGYPGCPDKARDGRPGDFDEFLGNKQAWQARKADDEDEEDEEDG